MGISAAQVKELREKTGAGMIDCKNALQESDGNMEKAVEILKRQGLEQWERTSGRIASQGTITAYVHHNGRIAVLVELACETDFVARNDLFVELGRDLSHQIAAMKPTAIDRAGLPAELVEKERARYADQLAEKPADLAQRILEGKLLKFYAERCLLDQPFVKDDQWKVGDLVKDRAARLKEKLEIRRFVRLEVGENAIFTTA